MPPEIKRDRDRGIMNLFGAIAFLMVVPTVALAASATLVERPDRLEYRAADGEATTIAIDGAFRSTVLSPDGKTIAYIRVLKPQTPDRDGAAELWLADGSTGTRRRLMGSSPSPDPKKNLSWYDSPIFSPSGKFIYVTAPAWGDEMAIHRVSVTSGKEQFVLDGELRSIIRDGPYRGDLLVKRHTAWPTPKIGFHYPVYLARADGSLRFRIPNMNHDDDNVHVTKWLSSHGWTAW